MPRRSNKAQEILEFVNEFVQENGFAPSVREIGAAVGLRSTASVSYHLQQLQEKGLLQSPGQKGRKRAIVTSQRPGQIPVVGVVTAGLPILASQNFEGFLTYSSMRTHDESKLFALRVKGDSMIEAGIFSGDYVIIEQRNTAENGEIVVCLVDDEATVKRFYKENGVYRLQPENRSMQPIIVNEVSVLGKVVALIRHYV